MNLLLLDIVLRGEINGLSFNIDSDNSMAPNIYMNDDPGLWPYTLGVCGPIHLMSGQLFLP